MMRDATEMFPIGADWTNSYEVTFSYKTDVITSRNGTEQRVAYRANPRISVQYTSWATGDEAQKIKSFLRNRQNEVFVVPDRMRRAVFGPGGSVGQNSFVWFIGYPDWLKPGVKIAFFSGDSFEFHTLTADSNTSVQGTWKLDSPLRANYPAGESLIYPAFQAHLDTDMNGQCITTSVLYFEPTFTVDPGSYPTRKVPAATVTFQDREVAGFVHNWTDGETVTYSWDRDAVDTDYGVIEYFDPVAWPRHIYQIRVLGTTYDNVQDIIDLFHRQNGMQGEFWWPTAENDFHLTSDLTVGQETFTTSSAICLEYAASQAFKMICIKLMDGTFIYREVSSMQATDGGITVTVSDKWVADVPKENVIWIGWMPLVRFASDDLLVEWVTDEVATIGINLQILPILTPDSTP